MGIYKLNDSEHVFVFQTLHVALDYPIINSSILLFYHDEFRSFFCFCSPEAEHSTQSRNLL